MFLLFSILALASVVVHLTLDLEETDGEEDKAFCIVLLVVASASLLFEVVNPEEEDNDKGANISLRMGKLPHKKKGLHSQQTTCTRRSRHSWADERSENPLQLSRRN